MKQSLILSSTDEKVLAMLRKQHEGWKTTRVIILAMNLIVIGICGWLYWRNETLAAGVLLVPAAYGLSYVLGGWHGRPEIALLFKVVEHAMAESDA